MPLDLYLFNAVRFTVKCQSLLLVLVMRLGDKSRSLPNQFRLTFQEIFNFEP